LKIPSSILFKLKSNQKSEYNPLNVDASIDIILLLDKSKEYNEKIPLNVIR